MRTSSGLESPSNGQQETRYSLPIRWQTGFLCDAQRPTRTALSDNSKSSDNIIAKPPSKIIQHDLDDYLLTCQQGTLYETLMTDIQWMGTKAEFKSNLWFRFLYGRNRPNCSLIDDRPLRALGDHFRRRWPSIASWMWQQKAVNFRKVAWQMQRAESRLMIDHVGSRLAQEIPHVPVLTIHDSYLTTPRYVDVVQTIILEEFAKLGAQPKLTLTEYGDSHHFLPLLAA